MGAPSLGQHLGPSLAANDWKLLAATIFKQVFILLPQTDLASENCQSVGMSSSTSFRTDLISTDFGANIAVFHWATRHIPQDQVNGEG